MAFKMDGPSLYKKPVGPIAIKKKVKKESDEVKIDPGFEDPVKIQELQRKGLTPGSQTFIKKKKSGATFKGANSKNSKCWKGCRKVGTKPSPTRPGVTVNDCKCD